MYRAISIVTAVGLLSACAPQPIKVPTYSEPKHIQDPPINGQANLFLAGDSINLDPAKLRINSSTTFLVGGETFAHVSLKPGKHWIGIDNQEKGNYVCKRFEDNTSTYYDIKSTMGMMVERQKIIEVSGDVLHNLNQVIKSYEDNIASKNIPVSSIRVTSENVDLAKTALFMEDEFTKIGFSKGRQLEIKLELLSKEEGSRIARYFWGGDSPEDNAKIAVKATFYIDSIKVDEYISSKELMGGIFGGSIASLYKVAANDLVSYTQCMYSGN